MYRMYSSISRTIRIALCALTLAACSDTDFEYASERCYFFFNNGVYLDATLQSALNPVSPGVFCNIYEGSENGRRYIYFASNQGLESKKELAGDDAKRTYTLGLYNKSGIIVGFGNLSSPAILYIYDNQCPNCYYETQTMSHRLRMDTRGFATCPTCKREYDLNNRGVTSNGKKLLRYRGNTNGTVLSVSN